MTENNESSNAPTFPEIEAVRANLEAFAAVKPWGDMGEAMLALVAALEKANQAAAHWEEVFDYADSPGNRANFIRVQKQLALAARHVASACRLVANKAEPGDRT